jgi:hypothetical protein
MPKERLLLYSPQGGPRLKYIASHIVEELLGIELDYTGCLDEVSLGNIPLINYSAYPVPGAINIHPSGLLEEKGISLHRVVPEIHKGTPVLFRNSENDNPGFDIFAAAFYMLSRYEEYFPGKRDRHGRYPVTQSMAYRYGLVEEPLVEMWAERLRDLIKASYPDLSMPGREYRFIPTFDIDMPWAYRNRGVWQNSAGFAGSFLTGDMNSAVNRFQVLFMGKDDPYDTWQFLENIHQNAGLSPRFFFSAGNHTRYDKSASTGNLVFRRLIAGISKKYTTGIHPSYFSHLNGAMMQREIGKLSEITGSRVRLSRQHYLRLEIPYSYRLLAENGITDDYTLGWAEVPGFRAGTCTPFLFYDLLREEVIPLRIWPFQIMDGTFIDYMNLEPGPSAVVAGRIIEKIKAVGGTLITLWHNHSFSERGRWKGWTDLYMNIIRAAA